MSTILLIVLAVAVPVTMYWASQRSDAHLRWDLESRYAQQFMFHLDYATALMNGVIYPWSNVTDGFVVNELAYANDQVYDIKVLDNSHADQLSRISYALETLRTQNGTKDYIFSMNPSQRVLLASQLYSLGHKIANAYWNFVNYTSTSPGVGPSFWYSGPSPPDENLLQSSATIALNFERK
jgi:hypothetical protein